MDSFTEISLKKWRQFASVEIDLSKQTTILTGANGCGKTTILNILGWHFGWQINLLSTPYFNKKTKKKIYSDLNRDITSEEVANKSTIVGHIKYSGGTVSSLSVPTNTSSIQYTLQRTHNRAVTGLHIPSHRPSISFEQISQLPTNPKSNQQHYSEFQNLLRSSYLSNRSNNPGKVLKESLISLALFGYGNEAVAENEEYRSLFESFQEILRIVLPDSLGFRKVEIRMPNIVLITDTGDFLLDVMSGGINSLFGLAWQIHMFGYDKDNCTVIIDEPENHLHPSMQRTLLPNLAKAFPNYHFIVSTHSPFIVTSNPEANVFGLIYNDNRKRVFEKLRIMPVV